MHELETLSAPRLRRLIERGVGTVVVPFGSMEDHGAHLPIGADALLADRVGRDVAARLGAVLAPTARIGHGASHEILSARSPTLTQLALDLAECLAKLGFRRIVLASAHGGNAASLRTAAERSGETLHDVLVCAPAGDVGPEPGRYSGEWLTSVMLALHPGLVDVKAADAELREELSVASAERGMRHIDRFVASIATAAGGQR